eukprot:CAMPEP_0167742800 /NCGR_PEP_ID=MMETSP0110_2-20121227/1645_1 /TAXON_ID=629695 /ORGANISM="Gymnochlora sp., Strain CCMP2014" /LENGTH=212 /DNA_ID=CAMNT_0007627067 /DNA_START=148 /DNA_END=784 /DNA_ORIENTATION=+
MTDSVGVAGGSAKVTPSFDVEAKAKEYILNGGGYYSDPISEIYDDDFVFKAATIGPLNKNDYIYTMKMLQPHSAFDLEPNWFGFTIDPENPLKIYFLLRVTGKHTRPWKFSNLYPQIEATNKEVSLPAEHAMIEFTPEGKIKFLSVGRVPYAFEGNSNGAGAIFGLFFAIGQGELLAPAMNEGVRNFINFLGDVFPGQVGKTKSKPEDLPAW